MAHILVVGGGLSGCAVSLELAKKGHKITIVEKAATIGGKVRELGCKATDKCNNCGVCLAGDLWERIENCDSVDVLTETELVDVAGSKGDYSVTVRNSRKNNFISRYNTLSGISAIIIATGFERPTSKSCENLELNNSLDYSALTLEENIISGFELEKLLKHKGINGIIPQDYSRVAFIQCFGSRDVQSKAPYCSRVCCGYSTRAAKALKYYHPGLHITFFYMDLQYVEENGYFDALLEEGFEFIRSRPVRIKPGKPVKILYENPKTGECEEGIFDMVVLTEGIHPSPGTEQIAEICTLDIDDKGFLKPVIDSRKSGIYVAGCASGPKRIEEVYTESCTIAEKVLAEIMQ